MRSIPPLIALFASSFLLASCATLSHRLADAVAPPRPPPDLCAPAAPEPAIPEDAGILKPVTEAERTAVSAFLQAMHLHADWGRALAARADKTAAWCVQGSSR